MTTFPLPHAGEYGREYVRRVGCTPEDADVMDCLRKVPLYRIMEGSRCAPHAKKGQQRNVSFRSTAAGLQLEQPPLFRTFEEFTFMPAVWKPVVDGAFSDRPFLPDNRARLAEEEGRRRGPSVPLLMGGNSEDGNVFMIQFMMGEGKFESVAANWTRQVPMLVFGTDGEEVGMMGGGRGRGRGPDKAFLKTFFGPLLN